MKNIFKTFLSLLTLGLFATSCNDAIDIVQDGEASDEVMFRNIDDLQAGLNGAYLAYDPGANSNGNGDAILFNDLFTDNLKTGSSYGGHGINMYQFNLQASSYTPESIWSNRYVTINYANRVLRAANRLESSIEPEDMVKFNNIKAQLLALRAIAHYDIFMYFTPDYKDASSLSAIIVDYVPEITDKPARNTASEVIDFILGDFDTASTLLTPSTTPSPFYINHDVIKAFKAKLYMATGNYSEAGVLATELLTKYPLADRAQYVNLFKDQGTNELIFGLLRVRGNSAVAGSWYANSTDINGSPLFEMSRQLYNLFETGDVRIDEVLLDQTSDVANNILLINKYPGSEQPLLNHLKVIRSSEMALILSEVQARNSDFTTAANTLKSLLTARYGTNAIPVVTFSSVNDALAKIMVERRKEFCFEGHRYLDIKRIGKEINVGIERLASDAESFASGAPTALLPTDYRFTLPIPQAEISANRNVAQNPNYTNN